MKFDSTEFLNVIHNIEPKLTDGEGERGFSREQLEGIVTSLGDKQTMRQTKTPLEWFVYVFDTNSRHIYHMNIFEHSRFNKAIKEILRDQTRIYDKTTFASAVRGELMYYFWSRVEYEVEISDVLFDKNKTKIDVYDQVMMNLDRFIDYLWGCR